MSGNHTLYIGTVVILVVCVLSSFCVLGAPRKTKDPLNPLKVNKSSKTRSVDLPKKSTEGTGKWEMRQGWGWSQPYSGSNSDFYSIIAVAAFAALLGALFFALATGNSVRSLGSSLLPFSLPFELSLSSDQMTELAAKVSDFVSDVNWAEVLGNATETAGVKSRSLRDVSEETGLLRWMRAYKKDPVDYQCVRKVACETLAASPLVANSMKSPFAGAILSAVGLFIENGEQLQSIVKDTIGNPDNCENMAPWGFCDEDTRNELNADADSQT